MRGENLCVEWPQDLSANPQEVKKELNADVVTLTRRLEGLEIVLKEDAKALCKYKASFKEALAGVASGSGSVIGRTQVGNAPPCATFEDLDLLIQCDLVAKDMEDCKAADDIKAVFGKIDALRQPVKDLQ